MGLRHTKKRILRVLPALMVALALFGCERTPPGPPPPPPQNQVRVLEITGEVTLDGAPLEIDYKGQGGGVVRAPAGAQVALKVGPDTVWRIIGPAEVRLDATPTRRHAELVAGRLGAAFRPGVTDVTMRIGAGIRGTVLYAEQTTAVPDYACVCEGKVELRHDHGGFARVNSQGHDQPLRVMPQGFLPQPVRGHGDAEVRLLKALLAR